MFIKLEFLFFSVLFSAAPVNRPSHTPENTNITTTASTWTTTLTSSVVTDSQQTNDPFYNNSLTIYNFKKSYSDWLGLLLKNI